MIPSDRFILDVRSTLGGSVNILHLPANRLEPRTAGLGGENRDRSMSLPREGHLWRGTLRSIPF